MEAHLERKMESREEGPRAGVRVNRGPYPLSRNPRCSAIALRPSGSSPRKQAGKCRGDGEGDAPVRGSACWAGVWGSLFLARTFPQEDTGLA